MKKDGYWKRSINILISIENKILTIFYPLYTLWMKIIIDRM